VIKKTGLYSRDMQETGLTIPENIKSRIADERKIKQMEDRIKIYKKRLAKTGDQRFQEKIDRTNKKINETQKNLAPIHHPIDELKAIREKLLTEKGLKKNFERTPEYHRLLDLSNVWHNARTLLDRIHVEHEYNRQEAFKTLADHYLKIADSNSERLAKGDRVVNYLKNRIEGSLKKPEPIEPLKQKVDEQRSIPTDSDQILEEQRLQNESSKADEMKEEFNKSQDRFKEFKKSENVFKNFLQCVMGAMNG
jgi:hypothetical protein